MKALTRNKFRAFLTMLGIIIGVGAVITMIALGRGAQEQVKERISSMGTDTLWVIAGSRMSHGISGGAGSVNTLTPEDFDAISRECPSVSGTSPTASTAGQVVYGNRNWSVRIEGFNQKFPQLRDWDISQGVFFDERLVRSAARVAVLGQTVEETLFPDGPAIGKTIRIGHLPFRVIGILAKKGSGPRGEDRDDTIIVPFTTVQKKFQASALYVPSGIIKSVSGRAVYAEEEIQALLRQRHQIVPGQEDDFSVINLSEVAAMMEATQGVMTTLLAAIAAVSLLVGGIGIMNIMLVSVSERTREIGIHMSIGARPSHVQAQFLAESVLLCILGGLIGLLFGLASSVAVRSFLGWQVQLSLQSIWVALVFPSAIGVFFGYYPAHKAARLDPIEALRYE